MFYHGNTFLRTQIDKTDRKLFMYCKTSMPVLGAANVSSTTPQHLPVQQTDALTRDKILSQYTDGLSRMEGQLHVRVNETVSTTVMPPCRLHIAVKGKVKEELTRVENAGVLKKVEEPTDWVSSMVVTAKSNKRVRIYIDPKHLNQPSKVTIPYRWLKTYFLTWRRQESLAKQTWKMVSYKWSWMRNQVCWPPSKCHQVNTDDKGYHSGFVPNPHNQLSKVVPDRRIWLSI